MEADLKLNFPAIWKFYDSMELPLVGDNFAANCLELLTSLASRAGFYRMVWEVYPVRRMDSRTTVEATLHINELWLIWFREDMKAFDVEEQVTFDCQELGLGSASFWSIGV